MHPPDIGATPAHGPEAARPRRRRPGMLRASIAIGVAVAATVLATRSASAADNPYQRGPDPTVASIAATYGPFATAQVNVAPGNGFNGGTIYYPTDTSQGTWGAVAIVPGYTARFADEEAWMGPRLASFGFVVIGVETNSTTDWDTARGTQLLAALDYLTQRSSVRDRVDASRLSVIGHSMGGGGALHAASQRPSLKAAIGLAPFFPSGNLNNVRVPTLIQGGLNDTVVTPSYLDGLYPGLQSGTPGAYVQYSGADHLFWTRANNIELRTLIPWLKIFVDSDTRYSPFLCPGLQDSAQVARYTARCSLIPSGTPSSPTVSPTVTPPVTTAPPSAGALKGRASGRCADITGYGTADGTRLQLYDCTGQWNQTWNYTGNTLVNPQSGKCLNAGSDGTSVNLWTCNGGNAQKWTLQGNGNLVSTASGKCLDAIGQGTGNGTGLQIYNCVAGGQGNQQWSLQ
ncbi:poly(ethylene terephthalate) hydrolase family protein [Paractinoplanes brasiliensis]|uniref:Dienelactone hydrolase n=1 Tax=Paractinoplanes brasiliensis TaxID=52695 RepID=A0A4R6JYZ5_9ACTN|nr:ricin-type beta-trefoil lectin domain protein [Actinoplanes brasiliensis]TDO41999.1 dienelactone hydrolase [Actinoplanes brasiliensis]GID33124.1 triacylglycerol lipase [Actinoplanes brasiliensis]